MIDVEKLIDDVAAALKRLLRGGKALPRNVDVAGDDWRSGPLLPPVPFASHTTRDMVIDPELRERLRSPLPARRPSVPPPPPREALRDEDREWRDVMERARARSAVPAAPATPAPAPAAAAPEPPVPAPTDEEREWQEVMERARASSAVPAAPPADEADEWSAVLERAKRSA